MGNTSQSQTKSQDVMDKYTFARQVSQGKRLYTNKKTEKQYITLQRTFPTSEMLIEYEGKMRKLLEVTHPYFLNETEHAMISSSTLCSMQFRVVHFFQHEPHTLEDELEIRRTHERYFEQKEIWSILCSSVLAMSHLTKNDVLCYTLHPRDIVIDKLGMIKILSPLIVDKGLQMIEQGFYYSPQHLKSLKSCNFSQVSNKSSVFTLGITLMHILSLQPMNELYNYDSCTINMQLLNQLIEKISQQEIRDVLSKMLKFHSYERITFTELEEMLYNVLEGNNKESDSRNNSTLIEEDANEKLASSIHRLYQADTQLQFKQTVNYQSRLSSNSNIDPKKSLFLAQNNNILICLPDLEDGQNLSAYQSSVDCENNDQEDVIQKNDNFEKMKSSNFNHKEVQKLKDSKISETNDLSKTRNVLQQRYNPNVSNPNNLLQKSNVTQYQMGKSKLSQPKIRSPNQQNQLDTQQTSRPYHVREQLSLGTYEGYKLNGCRHGYGVFSYAQGGKYAGQWFKNKMQGRGALYYNKDQIAYQGEWINDKLHGFGVLYNEIPTYVDQPIDYKSLHLVDHLWTKYEGNFFEDQRNGEGTLFLSNGEYFRGFFKQGLPHGNGIFKCLNGNVFKGTWILGIMQ